MESTDWARECATSWKRRSVELDARIRALHERNAQLSTSFGPPDFEAHRAVGSTPDHVARAEAAARMANMRALEALQRTVMMRRHAADAHDRAAQLHEMLADLNIGDVQEHRNLAALHRQHACEDRVAADELCQPQEVQPPEPGPS